MHFSTLWVYCQRVPPAVRTVCDRPSVAPVPLDDDRRIPSWVKLEVWKRDQGRCVYPSCGTTSSLHFDHIIPYSKGGSSVLRKTRRTYRYCVDGTISRSTTRSNDAVCVIG
jgi:5-methylcytosine-specific restriction endonuclease McrA